MAKKFKEVTVRLDILKLLCLNVDYGIEGDARDLVEIVSVEMQKKFKFDTHKYRLQLLKAGVKGAIPVEDSPK